MRDPTCKNWDETRSHFQRESPTTQQSLLVVSKETFDTGKYKDENRTVSTCTIRCA